MKELIRPMIVLSFVLTAASAIPLVPWYCALAGFGSLIATYAAGLIMFGAEEKDWTQTIRMIELQQRTLEGKIDQKINEASAALAKLRDEKRRSPLE